MPPIRRVASTKQGSAREAEPAPAQIDAPAMSADPLDVIDANGDGVVSNEEVRAAALGWLCGCQPLVWL